MFGTINKTVTLEVNMGTGQSGKTVGYTLYNGDGSTFQARTTTGVTEIQSGTGIYRVRLSSSVFTAAFDGYVLWDVANAAPYASEDIFISDRIDAAVSSRADGSVWTTALANILSALSTRTGTAQAGASGSITLDAGASGVTDFYVGQWVVITSGAGAGQSRLITAYNASTKVATVHSNWKTNPSNTSVFYLLAASDIQGVVLADTTTALTNTPSDSAGTTTLLGRLTSGRASNLDNLDATVSSRATVAAIWAAVVDSAGVTMLLSRLTSGRATNLDNLDATVSSRSTYAGADTAGTTTLLSRLTSTRAGYLDNLTNLDAAISGVAAAVWAAGARTLTAISDSSGVTTLLSRLTSGRATNLDNLDATVSSRSTYAGADTAGTTTLLSRLTSGRATALDNLDTTVSSRLAASAYTAPDNAGIADIRGKTDLIGAGLVIYGGPVLSADRIELVQGDDYLAIDGRALQWTSADWPSLTGATVTLNIRQTVKPHATHSYNATVLSASEAQVELTHVQTAALATGTWSFSLDAVLSNGHDATIASGVCVVVALP